LSSVFRKTGSALRVPVVYDELIGSKIAAFDDKTKKLPQNCDVLRQLVYLLRIISG
jgi:hypothetical protein